MMNSDEQKLLLKADDKVSSWLIDYPFLVDTLIELSPRYQALKKPVMRKTLGKVATWRMAASMGGIPLTELLLTVAESIHKNAGVKCTLDSKLPDSIKERERLEQLKGLILSLHAGVDVEEAKLTFKEQFGGVSAHEIAQMEQELITQGLPVEDVKALCDVHVSLFKDGLSGDTPESKPGHPVQTMILENEQLRKRIEGLRTILEQVEKPFTFESQHELWNELGAKINDLREIDKHYLRKENLLFPRLENHDFSGPSQVMWAVHDDIRQEFKTVLAAINGPQPEVLFEALPGLLTNLEEMITKEESILIPTSLDLLKHEEWDAIFKEEEEFGFSWVERGKVWNPRIKINLPSDEMAESQESESKENPTSIQDYGEKSDQSSTINLDVGKMSVEQLNLMLLHLPVELSFVDEDDTVLYYSGVPDKIFLRTSGVIGRKVQNCHPPKSLHLVNRILDEMKAGTRDTAEFWMENFMGKFVHIRYDAVRDANGVYRGCLEAVQDITDIRSKQGSKRLLEMDDES